MCSLHLTQPSVHTWSSGQPTVQRPGSRRGLPVGAGIRTHNLGLPQVSSPTLYPLGQRLPLLGQWLPLIRPSSSPRFTKLSSIKCVAQIRTFRLRCCVVNKSWPMIYNCIYFRKAKNFPVWLSGRTLRQLSERLWVRFPGNTCTNKNV